MEKQSTIISTLIFRVFSGIIGAFILFLIYPAIIKAPSLRIVLLTLMIIVLFFGYALGFGNKMEKFIRKNNIDK